MHSPRRYLSIAFILHLLLVFLLAAAPGWAVDCGETIGPDEVEILTQDLNCTSEDPALTLESGSILNLGGKTLNCERQGNMGIELKGHGSILQNGTITNCLLGVVVGGTGGHIITKVTVTMSDQDGFRVRDGSNGNVLTYNVATDNGVGFDGPTGNGFDILSDENEISYNTSTNNRLSGYDGRGINRTTFKENLASGNGVQGFFLINGQDNILTKNRAFSHRQGGFGIFGNRNTLRDNLAKNNGNLDFAEGFAIGGSNLQVISNKAIGNGGAGFFFSFGSGKTILGNWAKKNQEQGIRMREGAINNTLLGNVAVGNENTDLEDDNPNCDNNQWLGNRFKTSNRDCIK